LYSKLAILDPNLRSRAGHYLPYANAVTDAATTAGMDVIWVTSTHFPTELAPKGVRVRPLFSFDVFDEFHSADSNWIIENFNQLNHRAFVELNLIDQSAYSDCIFFFPNILHNQLYAVIEWTKGLKDSSRAICILRWQNAGMGYNVNRGASAHILELYRFCFNHAEQNNTKVIFASDTQKLADFYQRLSLRTIHRVPNPQVHRLNFSHYSMVRPTDAVIITFLGSFTRLRGSDILAPLVDALIPYFPQVLFRIQISDLGSPDAQSLVSLLRAHKGKISLFSGFLDNDVYNHLISTASLVLLPYSPSFYYWGSSGVSCEALTFGIPAVLTSNTTMHDEFLEVGAGLVAVDKYDVDSFLKACELAICNLDELRRKSREASKRFIARSSPAVFLDSLLKLATTN
jgi:glycosyltransferase involved in cell wall biosynthesis